MKLELIKEFFEDDNLYQVFELGLYDVHVTIYSNGNVSVSASKDHSNKFLPALENKSFGQRFMGMNISTASYGSLSAEEIKEMISWYEYAIEAAEIINDAFCE